MSRRGFTAWLRRCFRRPSPVPRRRLYRDEAGDLIAWTQDLSPAELAERPRRGAPGRPAWIDTPPDWLTTPTTRGGHP